MNKYRKEAVSYKSSAYILDKEIHLLILIEYARTAYHKFVKFSKSGIYIPKVEYQLFVVVVRTLPQNTMQSVVAGQAPIIALEWKKYLK